MGNDTVGANLCGCRSKLDNHCLPKAAIQVLPTRPARKFGVELVVGIIYIPGQHLGNMVVYDQIGYLFERFEKVFRLGCLLNGTNIVIVGMRLQGGT